jgi:hypothetical protein
LHRIGVSPLKIRLALDTRGISLSSGQIHTICRPSQVSAFGGSSAELINFVTNSGRRVAIDEECLHQERVCAAVFTQMPEENAFLGQFGDVIEIDGADAPLKLNWKIIPITVLDRDRHVHFGGIAFAADIMAYVIHWLLQTLLELCPGLADFSTTIITDEDSAFIPAVELFQRSFEHPERITHILCALHPERNFVKKIH